MKNFVNLFFTIILLWGLSAYAQQGRQLVQENTTSSSNRRLALVIGNGAYVNAPPLKNPPNDATDMAAALSKLGFNVEHSVNLTQKQMKFMIREFGQKLRGGGQGLFYFAGHGIQLRGRNYLIPVDVDIQSESDVEDQGVDANLVLGLMDEAGNGLNIVVLDACRNNPFARNFRSASRGLAQMDAPSGTLIAYATAPGSVASDGNARNGLYTQELLTFMQLPGLSIEQVFKQVRVAVRQKTQGAQTPWESSSLIGDFYFLKGDSTATINSYNPNLNKSYDILALIESYKAPPYPKSQYLDRETYNYRIKNGVSVPATLTDVFICDIWQQVNDDRGLELVPKAVSEQLIKEAMTIYLNRDWRNIRGYRPWTHWNFIRGLSEQQRDMLAKEVVAYITKNGVRDVK